MACPPAEGDCPRRFYGRRHGRRLRPGRQRLLDDLLPRLRIPVTGGRALDPRSLFASPPRRLWLEIGFGAGEHLAAQAQRHPEIGFLGCEPFVDGVANLLALVDRDGLANVRILDDDVRLLFGVLPQACLDRVFLLFNDPWPKRRHAKRRFLGRANLDALSRLMRDGAELRFASDHLEYAVWSLEQVSRHPDFAWTARRPADWRTPPADGKVTRYEAKALAAGRACTYLSFLRLPRT